MKSIYHRRLLSDKKIIEAYKLYKSSELTAKQVAEKYEVKVRTLRKYFKQLKNGKLGAVNRREPSMTPEQVKRGVKLYKHEGWDCAEIAEEFKLSYHTVYYHLKRVLKGGIERKSNQAKRRKKMAESYKKQYAAICPEWTSTLSAKSFEGTADINDGEWLNEKQQDRDLFFSCQNNLDWKDVDPAESYIDDYSGETRYY